MTAAGGKAVASSVAGADTGSMMAGRSRRYNSRSPHFKRLHLCCNTTRTGKPVLQTALITSRWCTGNVTNTRSRSGAPVAAMKHEAQLLSYHGSMSMQRSHIAIQIRDTLLHAMRWENGLLLTLSWCAFVCMGGTQQRSAQAALRPACNLWCMLLSGLEAAGVQAGAGRRVRDGGGGKRLAAPLLQCTQLPVRSLPVRRQSWQGRSQWSGCAEGLHSFPKGTGGCAARAAHTWGH